MQISFKIESLKGWDGNVVIIGIFEDDLETQLLHLESRIASEVIKQLKKQNFLANTGDVRTFQLMEGNLEKLIIVGLGKADENHLDVLRKASAKGARESIGSNGKPISPGSQAFACVVLSTT